MTWRFIDSGAAPGPRHMAIDEALLEAIARGQSPPVLRVFAFQPACLSLGRFQAAPTGVRQRDLHCRPGGIDIVRRPSGGRAVLHNGDLCYSVVAPGDDPAVGGSPGRAGIRDSYRRIALALACALELLGAQTHVAATFRSPPAAYRTASCFAPTSRGPHELSVDGTKVVGSAQVRRDGALLQQGSLRLEADRSLEARLLGESHPCLRDLLGRRITYAEASQALRRAFAHALGLTFAHSTLTASEFAVTVALERERYASPAWTWER